MTLDDDETGALSYWEGVELALRTEDSALPVTMAEWKTMRVSAAKAWIEANNRDYRPRKAHDVRNRRKVVSA
jgi:hypothetical protein